MSALLLLLHLTGPIALGQAPVVQPAPMTLEVEIGAEQVCTHLAGGATARFPLTLRITNRSTRQIVVENGAGQLRHVQVVATVEEFVPQGPGTPAVTASLRGGPEQRTLPPGAATTLAGYLDVSTHPSWSQGDGLSLAPGHYFLELAFVVPIVDVPGKRTVTLVSPYTGFMIAGAAAGERIDCRGAA